MISRRKIISRSLDNLDAIGINAAEEEEDVWYDKEKLFRDHINEVLAKWEQIDDEIWAKIIVFEKNRRVAKAYARSSVISINGSKNGFDGQRIGLNGFENPMRDAETKSAKKSIGDGFKIKMDDIGNILIKRYGKSNVYVQHTSMANEETVIGADVMQMPHMALSVGTSAKLFDMRKYTTNINREFARPYPESKRLERQCLSAVSLVKSDNNLINSPLWILVINVVAMDMLKNRLQLLTKSPSMDTVTNSSSGIGSAGTRLTMHGLQSLEDPYSTIESQVGLIYPTPAGSDDSNNSNNSSKSRRSILTGYNDESPYMPKPDYEIYNSSHMPMLLPDKKSINNNNNSNKNSSSNNAKSQQRKKQDDPYYCGLLARIPNFIKSNKQCKPKKDAKIARKISTQYLVASNQQQQIQHSQPQPQLQQPTVTHPPLPIATFHQQYPTHAYYPLYAHNHRLSQSQLSLWDARSLISAHE